MASLEHENRSLLQATYTPLVLNESRDDGGIKSTAYQAWDKRSYVAMVSPGSEELQTVSGELDKSDLDGKEAVRTALEAISASEELMGRGETGLAVNRFVDIGPEAIESALRAVLDLRARRLTQLESSLGKLETAAPTPDAQDAPAKPVSPPGKGWRKQREDENGTVYERVVEKFDAPDETDIANLMRTEFVHVPATAPVSAAERAPSLVTLPPAIKTLMTKIPHVSAPSDVQKALAMVGAQNQALDTMGSQFRIQPVGLLHLERLGFVPAGIERGELVYSLPLAPAEEIAVSHREWSNTSEEFQKIVTDFLETYSEEGVTEKSELAQATSSQTQHSMGFNAGVTASGQFGAVNVTASAGFNLSEASTKSEQASRNQSSQVTRKASSRAKQEHKMSFTTTTSSGTEQTTTHTIKNPYDNKVARVDYYQLVRKWKVDLYRYGVRLTYDLAIPEPGADIMAKISELDDLSKVLEVPFGDPNASVAWARFPLQPTDLTRTTFATQAALYGAAVSAPPDATKSQVATWHRTWSSLDDSWNAETFSLTLKVEDGFVVSSGSIQQWRVWWPGHGSPDSQWAVTWVEPPAGAHGTVAVIGSSRYNATMEVVAQVDLTLTDEAFAGWQLGAWAAVRDAAQARYYEQRQNVKDRISQLEQELAGEDPLSLRKIEREEVMKGVLRWLFGPGFEFRPDQLPADLYDPTTQAVVNAQTWATMLREGEVIKFIHQAIEWENMVYVLYPYFWSLPSSWPSKQNVRHPDPLHRAFLKSGSARVVLTIRPGFEQDFMAIIQSGVAGGLPGSHPYMRIAEEIQAYANTNYPGMKPANTPSARPLLTYRQRLAWDDMVLIIDGLNAFKEVKGSYPTTAQGLAAVAAFVAPATIPLKDPWGNPYAYASPGEYAEYDLVCLGADGKEGGEGEDADIDSWAEASLIGTWNEYTPTSALDIAFDDPMPSA